MQPKKISARMSTLSGSGKLAEKGVSKQSKGTVASADLVPLELQLAIQPADVTAQMNKELRVDVLATQARGLDTETFTLEFDPKILEFRDATSARCWGPKPVKLR